MDFKFLIVTDRECKTFVDIHNLQHPSFVAKARRPMWQEQEQQEQRQRQRQRQRQQRQQQQQQRRRRQQQQGRVLPLYLLFSLRCLA